MDTKKIETVLTTVTIDSKVDSGKIDVVVGESAKMDVVKAVNYIQSGKAEIEAGVTEVLNQVDNHVAEKTAEFDQNAQDKTDAFNSNAVNKTGDFNDNYTSKLNAFNQNAQDKTNAFDLNASDKTGDFNTNASNKTTDFNDNYTAKKALIDAEVAVAESYSAEAKQWAIGEPSEPSEGSAKYWAEQASQSVPNNGQLDIQVNGTSVATFTANQSGNTTANIVVGSGLPSQTGNAGKVLGTDGTDASWQYSIRYIGNYNSSTQYYPGDVVQYYYDNAYRNYLCIQPALNKTPYNETSGYWKPFDAPSIIRVLNDWGDKPILPFMMNGSSGNTITGIRFTPGTTSTIANFPTINTSTGLLKAPSGIDGYYTSAQVDALIPTVNNSTITFTQGGVNKGSFTLNQSSGATIALDAGGAGGIQNTATGTDSLTILGNATSYGDSINIGDYSSANGGYAVAIGGQSGDAYYAEASANGTSVGAGAGASSGSVAVGYQAQTAGSDNIAVGRDTYIDSDASSSVAIGNGASVTGEGNTIANSIQLGSGTNSTANSLQVGSYELLNTSTGLIPDARISTNIARTADVVSTSDLATCHVVVETYHSGANWYRVYSDGWCEQGGQISNLTTTVVRISLQKHFVDTNYSISMTQCVENATGQFAYIRNAPTTSSIDIKANSGTINKVYWEAKGYIS